MLTGFIAVYECFQPLSPSRSQARPLSPPRSRPLCPCLASASRFKSPVHSQPCPKQVPPSLLILWSQPTIPNNKNNKEWLNAQISVNGQYLQSAYKLFQTHRPVCQHLIHRFLISPPHRHQPRRPPRRCRTSSSTPLWSAPRTSWSPPTWCRRARPGSRSRGNTRTTMTTTPYDPLEATSHRRPVISYGIQEMFLSFF